MKHGQKAKGKAAKAKAPKKSSKKATAKSKTTQTAHPAKGRSKNSSPASRAAAGSSGHGRTVSEGVTFNNAVVGAAFKHAVKKYPTAFRRLTD